MGTALHRAIAGASQEPLADNLGWLLSQASHALTTRQAVALESLGIGPRGFCVLTTALSGEYTQTQLAQKIGLDKTTMVVAVDELERAGLAERRQSESDRRAHVIDVTPGGRRKVAEAERILAAVHEDVLATLPARARTVLIDALSGLLSGPLATPAVCSRPVRRRAAGQ